MSSSPRALSLEVWLGPMEGLKFLGDARGASQVVRIGRLQFDRQTKERNHLVLSAAQGVSGSHAEARFVQGKILLRDLGSANGTFAGQQAVSADMELKAGDIFLVSLTPILVGLAAPSVAPPPFEPVSVSNWEEPAWAEVLAVAGAAAERRHERHIDTRHLCEALLTIPDEGLEESFEKAGWTRAAALEELWTRELFRPELAWISEILIKPIQMPQAAGASVVVSPKVARFLDSARSRAGADAATARAGGLGRKLLASLVQDGQGPVGQWLVLRGVTTVIETSGVTVRSHPAPASDRRFDPDETGPSGVHPRDLLLAAARKERPGKASGSSTSLSPVGGPPALGTLGGTTASGESPIAQAPAAGRSFSTTAHRPVAVPPPPVAPPAVPERPAEAAPPPVPRPTATVASAPAVPAPPVRPPLEKTPADLALEARAREIAATVLETAAEYRFGAASDRRKAVKGLVRKELAPLAAAERRKLLGALREQFPVLPAGEAPVSEDDVAALRKRISDLERELAQARTQGPTGRFRKLPASSALPLATLISGEELATADKTVQVLRQVVEYALAMEGMTLGLVQSMTMPGNETVAFRLPNFRDTLRGLLGLLEQGKPVSVERVQTYLDELKRWQVATLAAFHQAPTEWFEKLWRRINPVTIESAPRSAGWKLRGESAEWWDMYKLAVRDLGPDVVHDQILQTVARLSREELDKLKRPH